MIDFPASLVKGLPFRHVTCQLAFPANDGWSLSFIIRGPVTLAATTAPDTLDPAAFAISATAIQTNALTAGRYWWQATAQKGDDVQLVDEGEVEITPNFADGTGVLDNTTHADRVLSAIEAVIEKRASKDQQSYKIGDRELVRMSIGELMKLRDRYRAEVARERRARRGVTGLFGQHVRVRF